MFLGLVFAVGCRDNISTAWATGCATIIGVFVKTSRVKRDNKTYEYLSLVEAVRDGGKVGHRVLFRLGEAGALRASGQLDRIVAALQAHAEHR